MNPNISNDNDQKEQSTTGHTTATDTPKPMVDDALSSEDDIVTQQSDAPLDSDTGGGMADVASAPSTSSSGTDMNPTSDDQSTVALPHSEYDSQGSSDVSPMSHDDVSTPANNEVPLAPSAPAESPTPSPIPTDKPPQPTPPNQKPAKSGGMPSRPVIAVVVLVVILIVLVVFAFVKSKH